jgi:hypothetical protein
MAMSDGSAPQSDADDELIETLLARKSDGWLESVGRDARAVRSAIDEHIARSRNAGMSIDRSWFTIAFIEGIDWCAGKDPVAVSSDPRAVGLGLLERLTELRANGEVPDASFWPGFDRGVRFRTEIALEASTREARATDSSREGGKRCN